MKINRRQILKWSTPVVMSVSLPSHAVTTSDEKCTAEPVLSVLVEPKCSGNPPVGTAVLQILSSDAACPIELKAVAFSTTDPKNSIDSLPSFPVQVTSSSGETITWTGLAGDPSRCLPLSAMSVEVSYCIVGGDGLILSKSFNILDLIVSSTFRNELNEPRPIVEASRPAPEPPVQELEEIGSEMPEPIEVIILVE